MTLLGGMCRRLGRIALDLTVVTALLIFVPGLPPYMKFESYSIHPARELEGELAVNSRLDKAVPILDGEIMGPESIAFRGDELYTGLIGGNVIKYANGKTEVVAKFGKECEGKWEEAKCGRPLGMRFAPDGKLIVADAYYGIFSVDVDNGQVVTLVSSNDTIDGKKPMMPNDLDVASDGTIYWSDSSTHSFLQDSVDEFLGEASGRLLRYNPTTKSTEVLIRGLRFANGVQISKNEDFVLVSESAQSRVIKYYLNGNRKGHEVVFIEGLPGSPDNIRSNGRGGMYISLIAPRYANKFSFLDQLGPHPYLRKFLLRILHLVKMSVHGVNFVLPNEYTGKLEYYLGHLEPIAQLLPKHAIIVEVDENGEIVRSFHGQSKVHHISEITIDKKGNYAYLGSPYNSQIWKIAVADLNPEAKRVKEINLT